VGLFRRILGNAVLYDAVQRAAGLERLRRRLSPVLRRLEPGALLDVGAGTGAFYELLPPHVTYVPLDIDPQKLERLRLKHKHIDGVVASATELPYEESSFDYVLCINVAHHLSDGDLELMLAEIRRVAARQIVFIDPLRVNRIASRLLWSIDRGSYPRSYDQLLERLSTRFVSLHAEAFTILHSYVLFVGTPVSR
jgi:ubiquinone/menaquinone biosynthesis C-methylase UbiE